MENKFNVQISLDLCKDPQIHTDSYQDQQNFY